MKTVFLFFLLSLPSIAQVQQIKIVGPVAFGGMSLDTTTGILPVSKGGTGTTTPSIVAGTNIVVTGTWPNQTISSSGSGSSLTLGAGVETALAITTNATGGVFTQGSALSATTVTASGAVSGSTVTSTSGNVTSGNGVLAHSLGLIGINTKGGFKAATDGNFRLLNNAQTLSGNLEIANLAASGTVTATGKISASIPAYANDAAADADATLLAGQLYKITGSRTVYQKP